MLLLAYFHWWYGPGWRDAAGRVQAYLRHTYLEFSVPILLRTLVSPWRRIITPGGGAIGQRFRAAIDNLFSRAIGLVVRVLALMAALLIMFLTLVVGGGLVLFWPILPALGVFLIVAGLLL